MDVSATRPGKRGGKAGKAGKPADQGRTLRELLTSPYHFWKQSPQGARDQPYVPPPITDKSPDGTVDRELPPNEVMAMALNEVAATRRRGFFFFLPSRHSWGKHTFEPASRRPPDLGAQIPSLVYMDFVWSDRGSVGFFQSPHRLRYLACDFLLNPPPAQTPVHSFQVAAGARYPLYATTNTSYIILQANSLYLSAAADLEAVVGRRADTKKRQFQGPDPTQRLDTMPEMWSDTEQTGLRDSLDRYKCGSLEEMYTAIVRTCHSPAAASCFTAIELSRMMPRPVRAESETALGCTTANATGAQSHHSPSGPQSRRGARLDRAAGSESPGKRLPDPGLQASWSGSADVSPDPT